MIFDKTGTLTEGKPSITDVIVLRGDGVRRGEYYEQKRSVVTMKYDTIL